MGRGKSHREEGESRNGEGEYEVEDLRDRIKSSRGSRFELIENELGLDSTHRRFSRQSVINGLKDLSQGLVIHPDNRSVFLPFFTFFFSLTSGVPACQACGGNVFLIFDNDFI